MRLEHSRAALVGYTSYVGGMVYVVKLQGESLSANTSAIQPFKCDMLKIIETRGYAKDKFFNADETGLWWHFQS